MSNPRPPARLPGERPCRDDVSLGWVAASFILICALFALTACGGKSALPPPEPIIRTVEVKVPVDDPACARAAVEELGTAFLYPDTDAALRAAADLFERVKLLMAGRELREAREAALTGALVECSRP